MAAGSWLALSPRRVQFPDGEVSIFPPTVIRNLCSRVEYPGGALDINTEEEEEEDQDSTVPIT